MNTPNLPRRSGWLRLELDRYDLLLKSSTLSEKYESNSISSLEGFEDLQLIGRLQLRDHMIARGDVVIEVTEGGETSAGIGTVLAARDQWKMAAGYDVVEASKHLFFLYNNPDDVLMPFERSKSVLTEAGRLRTYLNTAYSIQIISNLWFKISFYGNWDNRPPARFSGSDFGTSSSLSWTFH